MTPVLLLCRAELRRRARSVVLTALLLGLVGGVAMGGAAAARRTAGALDRFLDASHSREAGLFAFGLDPRPVIEHPDVALAGLQSYLFLRLPDLEDANVSAFRSADGVAYDRIDAGILLDGRRPDQSHPNEAVISPGMARRRHLSVGDTLRVQLPTPTDLDRCFQSGDCGASGPMQRLDIVGIVRQPSDLGSQPVDPEQAIWVSNEESIYLTKAFDPGAQPTEPGIALVLRHGLSDLPGVVRAAAGGAPPGTPITSEVIENTVAPARRALQVQSIALAALAGLVTLALLVVVGQIAAREVAGLTAGWPSLSGLGMRRRQLAAAAALRSVPSATAAAILAVAVSLASSAWTPFGTAHAAEPSPGLRFDASVAMLGAVTMLILIVGTAGASAWVGSRRMDRPEVPAPRSRRPALRGLIPLPVAIGAQMARRGDAVRARRAVHLTRGATIAGLTTVSALLVVLASFDHVLTTPRHFGWAGDLLVGNPNGGALEDVVEPVLARTPAVSAWSSGTLLELDVGADHLPVIALDTEHGDVGPPIATGRRPTGPNEVALGSITMRDLGLSVGDSVTIGDSRRVTVVGSVILGPPNGLGANVQVAGPGEGALVDYVALEGLVEPDLQARHIFFVRARTGTDVEHLAARLRSALGPIVSRPIISGDLLTLKQVAWLPGAVTGVLLGLAAATLGHALMSTVRGRQREFGILKAIGFDRQQLLVSVLALASVLVAGAVAVGVPLGAVAGRVGWIEVAQLLGIAIDPILPLLVLCGVAAGAVALGGIVATVPGRWAARTPAAEVLRIE